MMPPATAFPLDTTEHQIFWMLVKKAARRDDVGRAYLALQAALAHGQKTVDVSWLIGAMMPDGQPSSGINGEVLGASGLAYFHWLYEMELHSVGDADRHDYRVIRRADGAQIIAFLRTSSSPRSLQFRQEYERQRRKLEGRRETFLATFRKGKNALPSQ